MREIKFRAWDKGYKFMTKKVLVGNTDSKDENYTAHSVWIEPELVDYECEPGWKNFDEHSNIILMQYTGLKDSKGNEIYEGDVLKVWQKEEHVPIRDSGGGIIDYDLEHGFSQVGVVGFTSCSFDYKTVKTIDGKHEEIHAPIDWINNYEVIGNIYENPNLLEGESK